MAGVSWVCSALMAVTLVVACRGREKAAGSGDGPFGDRVAAAVPRIEEATGLTFRTPPKVESRSREQVRAFLESQFRQPHVLEELKGMEVAYKLFGLLPGTVDLEQLMIDLLTEQIVGYYDPGTKVLYVVAEAPEELIGITITHELVHALQDQYLNLDSIQRVTRQNDRSTAAQAVIEGQAVYEQMALMLGGDVSTGIPGGWDRVRQMIREQSSTMPRFATAPMIVQETVIFPYLSGAEFVRVFKSRRPGKSPLDDLPTSTELVLNPDKHLAERRDLPVGLTLPAPRTGTEVYQNTLGAFETRLFLYQHLKDESAAMRAAAGWGGDRYQVVRTPAGDGVLWVTLWDTDIDAAEFHDVLERALTRRWPHRTEEPVADGRRYAQGQRHAWVRTMTLQGRPAVVFMDFPRGTPVDLVDLARITLAQ
jgi:hypothetical protein